MAMNHALRCDRPVLLVHGIFDTAAVFDTMATALREVGFRVHTISLKPNIGNAPLEVLAAQVRDYVDQQFEPGEIIDLVGFSMGGLVTRYYLQRLGGMAQVQHYISISAPNNGTLTAFPLPLEGIKQMRPHSDFLTDLNQDVDRLWAELQVKIFWTPFDLMILPAHSSVIAGHPAYTFPVKLHKLMISDRRVIEGIIHTLGESESN